MKFLKTLSQTKNLLRKFIISDLEYFPYSSERQSAFKKAFDTTSYYSRHFNRGHLPSNKLRSQTRDGAANWRRAIAKRPSSPPAGDNRGGSITRMYRESPRTGAILHFTWRPRSQKGLMCSRWSHR